MKRLIEIYNTIKQYFQPVLLGVIVLLVILLCWQCSRASKLSQQVDVLQNNIVALRDTVAYSTTVGGEHMGTIQAFQARSFELKDLSPILYQTILDYEKTTGAEVESGVYTETVTELPPADTVFVVQKDSFNFTRKFDFSDQWRTLTGEVSRRDTQVNVSLDPEIIHANITTGIDENSRVFVKTDNPYIQFTDIKGFTVPKAAKKRWGLGINIGGGAVLTNQKINIGPYVGVGISYNILQW